MSVTRYLLIVSALVAFALSPQAEAKKRRKKSIDFPVTSTQLENLEPGGVEQAASREPAEVEPVASDMILSSGDNDDDVDHYHTVGRRMGVDLGMMIPFNDYANDFTYAPMIGFHMQWEAIAPLSVLVEMRRSSSPHKNTPSDAKLSVNTISVGTLANFGVKRFSPFVKLAGALHFNDVSFNDGRKITSGNDFNLTTVGINAGLGVDFIVGREISVGLDITYYYSVPKKLAITDGTNITTFDLGSPYAIIGLRVNF